MTTDKIITIEKNDENNSQLNRNGIILFMAMTCFWGIILHNWPLEFIVWTIFFIGIFVAFWEIPFLYEMTHFIRIDVEPEIGDKIEINLTQKRLNIENQATINFSEIVGITIKTTSLLRAFFIYILRGFFTANCSVRCIAVLYLKDRTQQLITIATILSGIRFYKIMSQYVPVKFIR